MNALTMEEGDKKFPMDISQILKIIWSKNPCRFIENTPLDTQRFIYLLLLHFAYVKSWIAPVQPPRQADNCYIFFCTAATTSTIGRFPKQSPAQPRSNPSPCRHWDSSALVLGVSQEQVRVLPLFLKIK